MLIIDRCGTACMSIRADHLLAVILRSFLMMVYSFLLLWALFVLLVPLCCEFSLLVLVPSYRSSGPSSIPGATRYYEKWWVWNWVLSAS
jgi:hypothetical protein